MGTELYKLRPRRARCAHLYQLGRLCLTQRLGWYQLWLRRAQRRAAINHRVAPRHRTGQHRQML